MILSRRKHGRWFALVAALILSVQSLSIAHLLLGRHGVCAEHGETIELSAIRPHSSASSERAAIAESLGDDAEHSHCELALLERRARTTPEVQVFSAAPLASDARIEIAPPLRSTSSSDTYRIAPKASPPVRLA